LGKSEELTNKNTVFGRVAGDTIYNLAKMGEAEVAEGTERPLYPMKITHIEILINPFDDMKKRERKVRQEAPSQTPEN
jgi:peptidyl-prolyl cis-trans isomerase SDCCAG10